MSRAAPNYWTHLVREQIERDGRSLPADVIEELAAHIADVYAAERRGGRSDSDARTEALKVLAAGNYADIAARRRSAVSASRLVDRAPARVGRLWTDLAFDLRYGLRSMRRQATLSLAIVTILAGGIGATTAAYAVVESVLMRPLPYPDSGQLVVMKRVTPKEEGRAFSAADWLDYARRHGSSVALAAYASWPMNLTGEGEPERLQSTIVSGDFFAVARTAPLLGRVITRADDTPSSPTVVVVSHGFWERRFGGQADVIGRQLILNGRPAMVVGVMPREFALPAAVDLWMPMGLAPEVLADRAGEWLSMIGRLEPGVSLAAAQADLLVTSALLAREYPRTNANERAILRTLLDETVGGVRRPLWLGSLAAVFVLLAGCANAANLMLARATMRRDEMAIRAALGAEPARLARQLFVESGVLAAAGGAPGIGAAWAFLRGFVALAGARVPRAADLRLDAAAVLVAALVAVATTWLVGSAAAWLLVRTRARAAERVSLRDVRSSRLGAVLVGGQVAFAMMLVVGAGAVVRGYASTAAVDPGFDTTLTMTMQLTLPRAGYADNAAHARFVDRTLFAIGAIQGVASAGVVSDLPFVGNATSFRVAAAGEDEAASRLTTIRFADPGFFRTLRIPLEAGRLFEAADRADAPAVAILNRTAAGRYGGKDAIGRRLHASNDVERTVIGIVGDIRHGGLHSTEGAVVYVPYAQKRYAFINWMGVVVRGGTSLVSASSLKAAVANVDPAQPVQAVQPMSEYLERETAPYRFGALVVGSLATAALVLAITGIYGLAAFVVGRRTRELGVRLALGASRSNVVLLVVGQILLATIAGLIIGAIGSVMLSGVLDAAVGVATGSRALVDVAVGAVLLAGIAVGAALGPALRAAHIDPRTSIQCE